MKGDRLYPYHFPVGSLIVEWRFFGNEKRVNDCGFITKKNDHFVWAQWSNDNVRYDQNHFFEDSTLFEYEIKLPGFKLS